MRLDKIGELAATASRWLMLLYVALLPIVRPLDTRILGIHIFATDLIFFGAFLFWLVSLVKRRPGIEFRFLGFVAVFFLSLTISAIFSTEPQKSFLKLSGVFYLIAVSIVVADLIQDLGLLKQLAYAWTAGAIINILGAIAGLTGFFLGYTSMATNFFLFHWGSLPPGNYPRVMGFFENPNMMANYTNVAIMIILGASRVSWMSKRVGLLLAALLFASTILAVSPGLGGMILSIGLWTYFFVLTGYRRTSRVVLVAAVFLAVLAFASTAISPVVRYPDKTITIPIIEKSIEPSVRFLAWQNSMERGLEYPILGRGTGTDAAHLRYDALSGQRQMVRDAHQSWLNVFGQAGIVGLIAFAALCWHLFSICRFRPVDGSDRSVMLVSCSCAFVGAFLFQNLSGSFEDARQLWVLIGMLVGLAGSGELKIPTQTEEGLRASHRHFAT